METSQSKLEDLPSPAPETLTLDKHKSVHPTEVTFRVIRP